MILDSPKWEQSDSVGRGMDSDIYLRSLDSIVIKTGVPVSVGDATLGNGGTLKVNIDGKGNWDPLAIYAVPIKPYKGKRAGRLVTEDTIWPPERYPVSSEYWGHHDIMEKRYMRYFTEHGKRYRLRIDTTDRGYLSAKDWETWNKQQAKHAN